MFAVDPKDYIPLADYTFAWRWRDADRVDIPVAALRRIRPLSTPKAGQAWEYVKRFQGDAYWSRSREVGEFAVDGQSAGARSWLAGHLPGQTAKIYISWTQRMALETDSALFIEYWDTFCFPVEDVVIWPPSENWVLLFDYKERFYYAVEKTAAPIDTD